MRTLLCLCPLLLLFAAPATAQKQLNVRFSVAPDVPVRIQNIAGSVRVQGWDRDSVAIVGLIREPPGQPFKAVHDPAGGGVKIAVWDAVSEKVPPSTFDVYVPAGSQVWVRTASSSIHVSGVTGGVDVNSVSGRIDVVGAPRELIAESMTGAVTLYANTRVLRAKTLTGALHLRGTVSDASATSVGGDILVEGSIERGRFESIDGAVRFNGELSASAALDFINHDGAVELILPLKSAANIVVSTHEGTLQNEFNVQVRNMGSKLKGSEYHFTLGPGGARIDVRTFRGRVTVRPR
jgi:hypothetical protein